jgi:hypothetical protein
VLWPACQIQSVVLAGCLANVVNDNVVVLGGAAVVDDDSQSIPSMSPLRTV